MPPIKERSEMNFCNDYGDAIDCAKIPDERYTMSFDDIGQDSIYWCSVCGPKAQALDAAITSTLAIKGIPYLEKFERAINEAHERIVKS